MLGDTRACEQRASVKREDERTDSKGKESKEAEKGSTDCFREGLD